MYNTYQEIGEREVRMRGYDRAEVEGMEEGLSGSRHTQEQRDAALANYFNANTK